jgi:type IV pilus assembly protein PilV
MHHRYLFKKSSGLTLIEVLVTMTITSIGLLSMASLQITGVRSISGSSIRVQATVLANDIAERMRANPTAVNDNLFMDVDTANINCNVVPEKYCAEYYDGTSTTVKADDCDSTEMATYDLNVWNCGVSSNGTRAGGLQQFLPGASAQISCIDTNPAGGDADLCTDRSPHTITVSWTEINPDPKGEPTITQNISMNVQL